MSWLVMSDDRRVDWMIVDTTEDEYNVGGRGKVVAHCNDQLRAQAICDVLAEQDPEYRRVLARLERDQPF